MSSAINEVEGRFAARLRLIRLARGLSQFALADLAGLPRDAVHLAENSRHRRRSRRVSVGEATALCAALGVPLDALLRPEPLDPALFAEEQP